MDIVHSRVLSAEDTPLKRSSMSPKKKMIIWISIAGLYLAAVLFAGIVMSPDLYGVNYENKFIAPSLDHPSVLILWAETCSGEALKDYPTV